MIKRITIPVIISVTLIGICQIGRCQDQESIIYFCEQCKNDSYNLEEEINDSLLCKFMDDWKNWSKFVKRGAEKSEYNSIFQKYYAPEMNEYTAHGHYIVLPHYVKVIKYDCNIGPDTTNISDSSVTIGFHDAHYVKKHYRFSSISYFTPVIEGDVDVLYMERDIERLLTSTLNEPAKGEIKYRNGIKRATSDAERQEVDRRISLFKKYISLSYTNWWTHYWYLSTPYLQDILVGNDGYYIELNNVMYGEEYFVPWNGEKIEVSEWIS